MDLPKNSSKTRKTSIISGAQLNIIASILALLKIFFEVIAASKSCPLARIEKQAVSLKLESFCKIREAPVKTVHN